MHTPRARWSILTLAVAALTVLPIAGVAGVEAAPGVAPGLGASQSATEPPVDEFPTSTGEQVAEVAAQGAAKLVGISVEDAKTLLAAQGRFGQAVDRIREQYPERLSIASWNKKTGLGEINLVKDAPTDAVTGITALATAAGARVTAVGEMSESARSEQTVRLSEAIRAAHPDLTNLSVHPSEDYSGLVVESPEPVSDAVDKWAADPQGGDGTEVEVVVQPGREASSSGGVVGGAQLNYPGGSAACTSGFTIKIAGDVFLLTAGHCPTGLNYGNNAWLGSSYPQRLGAWGDLQYHWIYNGGVGLPQFQYTSGAVTFNKHVSGVYAGQIVNRYGRNTSDTLEVDNPDSTETIENVTVTHVAVTYPHTYTIGGDSVGPWWIGASGGAAAVGIHKGSMWISFPVD